MTMRIPDGLIVRKSFALPYGGGMIWCEELDTLGEHEAIVRAKFDAEMETIRKPSSPGLVALHVKDTQVDNALAEHFLSAFRGAEGRVQRLAVIGLGRKPKNHIKKLIAMEPVRFAIAFFEDYEEGKGWLAGGGR